MPKKKATIQEIIGEFIELEVTCPYCFADCEIQFPNDIDKGDDTCWNCQKEFIVDVKTYTDGTKT